MFPFIENSRKCKLIYTDRHLLLEDGAWGAAGGRGYCRLRKLSGVMDVFTSLMVVIISCV